MRGGLMALGRAGVLAGVFAAGGHGQEPAFWNPTTRPVWRTPAPAKGIPVVKDGAVYCLTRDHFVLKVALGDGSEIWRAPTGESGVTVGATLKLSGTAVLAGEYDITAIDGTTGRHRWRFSPDTGYAPGVYMGDAEAGVVFAGSASGHLYAIDTATGRQRWITTIDPDGNSTVYWPRLVGDAVIAGFTVHQSPQRGGLVSVSRADGRVRWRFEFPDHPAGSGMTGGPVTTETLVIAASGDGRIWALDRGTGAERWVLPPVAGTLDSVIPPGDQDYRPLGLAGSTLVAGSVTGYVIGFDVGEPREVWRHAGGRLGSTAFGMTTTADRLFIPYFSGFLLALDAGTGTLLWRTDDWQQGFIWSPAVAGDRVIASSNSGLWALPMARDDP